MTERYTDAQLVTLRWLTIRGDSTRLPRFQSRGLASLQRRGLVENIGGRGRNAKLVLTAEGRDAVAALRIQGRIA